MRVTTKARHAVAAMVDLALQSRQGPTALSDIGRRQGISLSYLEQLFGKLRRAGLVASSRGPGGGYVLGSPAESITAADIVRAVDEPAGESDGDGPTGTGRVLVESLWADATDRMFEFLATVTVASLAGAQAAAGVAVEAKSRGLGRWGEPVAAPVKTDAPNSIFDLGDRARR